jgi:hypothetical protein
MTGKVHVLLALVVVAAVCLGQPARRSARTASIEAERLLEDAMAQGREAFLVDALSHLRENPIDLNTASVDALCLLPGVDAILARRIVDARAISHFSSLNDLLRVDGIDDTILATLEPFIIIPTSTLTVPEFFSTVKYRTRVSRSLSDRQSVESGGYLGAAEKVCNRITANVTTAAYNRTGKREAFAAGLGFLTEKDPGERDMADFISGYAHVDLPAFGIRFIVGDFGVDAAHGEVFSSSGSFAGRTGSTGITGLMKGGVRPSLASESSANCRGATVTWMRDPISISLLASVRFRDAMIDSTGAVKSWSLDGYHRTSREMSNRHQVREKTLGGRVRALLAEGFELGLSWYSLKCDRVILKPDRLGTEDPRVEAFGLDIVYVHGDATFSGEVAQRTRAVRSCVLGYRWSHDKTFAVSLLVRMNDCKRPESALIGIGGMSLEPGYRWGATWSIRFQPAPWLRLSALYDQFRLPRRPSANALPSSSDEVQLNAECKPAKNIDLELRYRHTTSPARENLVSQQDLAGAVDGNLQRTQLRTSLTVRVSDWIRSRSRIELSEVDRRFGRATERGLMMFHECSFYMSGMLSVSFRGIAFQTGSFESRIYEFEEEVPGSFQNPALYGRGFRWFIRSDLQWGTWLTCSLKYAQGDMRPIDLSGSTAAASQFRHDERWSMQLDVAW